MAARSKIKLMKFNPEKPKYPEAKEKEKFSEQAVAQEKNLMEKFHGKAGKIAGLLMLVSALSFLPENLMEQENRDSKETPAGKQSEQSPEQKAINILQKLQQIPDNPRCADNPALNELQKERVARAMVEAYALILKSPEAASGHVTPEEIRAAVKELMTVQTQFADQILGNNDGQLDPEEMAALNSASRQNAGLKALNEMFLQFAESNPKNR